MNDKRQPDEQPEPETVRQHILAALKRHPTLRVRIVRSLQIALHSRGIVSVEQIQDKAEQQMPAPHTNAREPADEPADDNAPQAARWDKYQREVMLGLIVDYAVQHFTPTEIDDIVNLTHKRDEAQALEEIATLSQISFGLLKQKVKDFCAIPAGQLKLPEHEATSVRVALIKCFISDQLEFVGVAKKHLAIRDFEDIVDRIIGNDTGLGPIGGKAGGMVLGAKILARAGETDPDAPPAKIHVPESFFVRADAMGDFFNHNGLQEFYDQKYKPIDEIRRESGLILRLFRNADFPPDIVAPIRQMLEHLGEQPLIVRSSSLLEDRFGTVFAGKYRSIFVVNQGGIDERLEALLGAIAEVYASTLMPDPISYRQHHNLLDYNENMGVLIQKIVGRQIGPYFLPVYAGVGLSHNPYRRNPRIRPEDGLARIVFGLGTRAVDRVATDFPRMIPLGLPSVRPEVQTRDIVGMSQRQADVIDLEQRRFATVDVTEVMRHGGSVPGASKVFSTLKHGFLRPLMGDGMIGDTADLVVTFDNFCQSSPIPAWIRWCLQTLEKAYGCPVDIEFASDGVDFYLLQCRPQATGKDKVKVRVPTDVPPERHIFSADRDIISAAVHGIEYVVLIDPRHYNALETVDQRLAIAQVVRRLNQVLEDHRFILLGPGRWGSKDLRLGIRVGYADINNSAMLIEIARRQDGYLPEVSFGSHFFQDMVESDIHYLALYPDEDGTVFAEDFLYGAENQLAELLPECAEQAGVVQVIHIPRANPDGLLLNLDLDGERQQALGYLAPRG